MGEFFRGWRRKVGLLTLMMALLFMVGWVRSYSPPNLTLIVNGTDNRSVNRFSTKNASFVWEHIISSWRVKFVNQFLFLERENSNALIPMSAQEESIQWGLNICGFVQGKHYQEKLGNTRLTVWKIPCWSIVVPLTVISSWLLLTRPRKSTPKKIIEPITEKVA